MPIRSKSVVIRAKHSRHHRDLSRAEGSRRGKKKSNLRHSPFSLRYARSKVLIFHRLVLACRTRTPPMVPPLARARVHGEVTVPLNGEIYVRQQNEDRRGNDDDGEREVDAGTGARWWFRRFNWNVQPALKSPHRTSLSRYVYLCISLLCRYFPYSLNDYSCEPSLSIF